MFLKMLVILNLCFIIHFVRLFSLRFVSVLCFFRDFWIWYLVIMVVGICMMVLVRGKINLFFSF